MSPRNRNAPTLEDVARLAGTNKASVSVVVNGSRSGGGVSEATRRRILAAAQKLQYRPNVVARSLRRRSTNVIGFYSGQGYMNARNAYIAEIIGGLQSG